MTTERMSEEEIEAIEDRLSHAGLGMEHDPNSIAKLTLKEITIAVLAIRQLLAERRWKPISEAPKDGTPVLIARKVGDPLVGRWTRYSQGFLTDGGNKVHQPEMFQYITPPQDGSEQ